MQRTQRFGLVVGVLLVVVVLGAALPLMASAQSETTTSNESVSNGTADTDVTNDTVTGTNVSEINVTDNNATDTATIGTDDTDTGEDETTSNDTAGDDATGDSEPNATEKDGDADGETGSDGDTPSTVNDDVADGKNGKAKVEDDDATSGANGKAKADDAGEGTSAEEGRLVVAALSADDDGTDAATLNDEFVTYRNVGDEGLNLTGWTVTDADGNTYAFPAGFELAPGAEVTLYTGNGTDTAEELYWNQANEVWNDGADTMTVRNADGTVVLERSYTRG